MFENKKILVLGFARSGYEVSKVLIQRNNEVVYYIQIGGANCEKNIST